MPSQKQDAKKKSPIDRRQHIRLQLVVRLRREGASAMLDDNRRSVRTSLATLLDGLTLGQRSQEPTNVGVTSSVGVNQLLLRQGEDRILGHVTVDADDSIVASLGDDYGSLPVLESRNKRQTSGNELNIIGLPALRFGPGSGLSLISKEEVDVRDHLHEDCLERRNLHEEWRRQVHAVEAAVLELSLSRRFHRCRRHRGKETSRVHNLSTLNYLPISSLLAMLDLVIVGRFEVGAQRAFNANNKSCAS